MAIGADRGILLETDGSEWDPQATALAIADSIAKQEAFESAAGNEAADSSTTRSPRGRDALGLPC
jgi:electron transfer flavoprotein alpha/beta subunit